MMDVAQFDLQHSGLNGVQSAVDAFQNMIVLIKGTVPGKTCDSFGQGVIVGHYRPTISVGTKILSRIKGECGRMAEGAHIPALILSEMCLGAILDHEQPVS